MVLASCPRDMSDFALIFLRMIDAHRLNNLNV
jgi:hypothetical protein